MTHDQLILELDDLAWRLTRSAALLRYYGGLNADMARQARDLTQAAVTRAAGESAGDYQGVGSDGG